MEQNLPIRDIYAREILDSRGIPTLETEVLAGEDIVGTAAVPAEAYAGKYEATELRDGDERYDGKGVEQAVENVNSLIAPALIGMNVFDQEGIDRALIKADGTRDKSGLGANAILGVSMAAVHTAAAALKMPLYRYLGGVRAAKIPVPAMNVMGGGTHGSPGMDIREYMIMPAGGHTFREMLRMCAEVYHQLGNLLRERGMSAAVGDEGGFAQNTGNVREVLRMIRDGVERAGLSLGRDIQIALNLAASQLYDSGRGLYVFPCESRQTGREITRSTEEMTDWLEGLASEFPICAVIDPLDQDDWTGWQKMTERLGKRIQLAGDSLFATNTERLKLGIDSGAANGILIKVGQAGTLTEAFGAIRMAQNAGYQVIISQGAGETEDTTIADMAVAFNAEMIRTGAPCRSERVAKYNRLLRIEESLEREKMSAMVKENITVHPHG